jgi:hypothetical protein
MTEIIMKNYLAIALLSIFLLAVCSRNAQANPNPESMIQNDVMLYSWDTSIEEIHRDYVEKQFQKITISGDKISANVNFFGLSSDLYFRFFNGKMFRGGISYLGFPGEPEGEDEYTVEDILRIKETILKALIKKYGKPQETEESERLSEGGGHYSRWDFSNGWELEFSLSIKHFILTSCDIDVIYTNIPLFEERRLALAPAIVPFPTHAEIIAAVESLGASNVYITKYTSRDYNYNDILSGNEGDSPANNRITLGLNYTGSITIKEVEETLDKLFINKGFTTGNNFFTEGGRRFDIGKYIPLPTYAEIIALIENLGASNVIISSYTSKGNWVNAGNEGSVASNSDITIWLRYDGKVNVTHVKGALIGIFTKAGFTHYGVKDGRNFYINS